MIVQILQGVLIACIIANLYCLWINKKLIRKAEEKNRRLDAQEEHLSETLQHFQGLIDKAEGKQ